MVRFLRFARNGLRAARPHVQERLRKSFLARCPNSYSVFSTQGGSSFQLRSLHQHSLSETCVPCSHPCFYRLASDSIFEVLLRSIPQWSGTRTTPLRTPGKAALWGGRSFFAKIWLPYQIGPQYTHLLEKHGCFFGCLQTIPLSERLDASNMLRLISESYRFHAAAAKGCLQVISK